MFKEKTMAIPFIPCIKYRTVVYEDGTLILNESSRDMVANREAHGTELNIFDPMDEDHDYVFDNNAPWGDFMVAMNVKKVEVGSIMKPTSTAYWFYGLRWCEEIDLTNLDTSETTDMTYMFGYVGYNRQVGNLDLRMLDTHNVTSMRDMFNHVYGAEVIDVSSFDTSNVTDFYGMFRYCNLTQTIYASDDFVVNTPAFYMFGDCYQLIGGLGTAYSYDHQDSEYARIDNPTTEPGYFTRRYS